MARRKAAVPDPYRAVSLTARVVAVTASDEDMIDAETAQQWLGGITHQTLRNYIAKGLPVERAGPRAMFRVPELLVWQAYHEHLKRENRTGGVGVVVSIEAARDWHLRCQYLRGEEPEGFVLVPRAWNHPLRERQLQLAVSGVAPAVDDST
jgi:hypothetical protein